MKKRIFALLLTLVFLIPVLPGVVLADTEKTIPELKETKLEFTGFAKQGSGFSIDPASGSLVLDGKFVDTSPTSFRSMDMIKLFNTIQEEYITQEICIEEMPVIKSPASPNSHISSGFFMACTRNVQSSGMNYIKVTIVRTDDAGNLSVAIAKKLSANQIVHDTLYPLNKKLGDTFKLTVAWHEDNTMDIFCDGKIVASYDDTATYFHTANSARKEFIRIGYSGYGAENAASTNVKIVLKSLVRGNIPDHVHTPAEDDGDCTTAVKCTTCDDWAIHAASSHKIVVNNAKYPTTEEKGYTGDLICYTCRKEIAKGEEIPVLEAVRTLDNQDANNSAIYIYIAIGAAVFVAVAVVVAVLVIRKKRNRKEPKDSV